MFAIITTDEYKELLIAKETETQNIEDLKMLIERVSELKGNLTEILQLLTKGGKEPEIGVTYESWDILHTNEIAKYINEHYVADGKLQFEKVKENKNE